MGPNRLKVLVLIVVLITTSSSTIWASSDINVAVKTVLASQDSEYFDPRLSTLVEELKSLFRYSSYRLLGQDDLALAMREKGTVSLPGNRVLEITPKGVKGKRVELQLVILKQGKQIFETVVQLLNHGSIIVGGPKYQQGSLLFNISASF